MRFLVCSILLLSLTAGFRPSGSRAQESGIAPKHHAWGSFKPGAWKQVRVETETLDQRGFVASKSTTETETTLMKSQYDGITLMVEVAVEVAGKRFDTEPQILKQGFHGKPACEELKIKEPKDGQITIEGRKIPCQIIQLECRNATRKTVTTLHYSAAIPPYVLRRQSITTDPDGQTKQNETTVSVVALQMPCKVLNRIRNGALLKGVQRHPKGTITTWTYASPAVPGGVISYSSKELDASQRLIRRSTLTLTGYGLESEPTRIGLFGRRRLLRFRTPKMP